MLGVPLRYLRKHPLAGLADLLSDPLENLTKVHETYLAERENKRPQCAYTIDDNWEQRLHEVFGFGVALSVVC